MSEHALGPGFLGPSSVPELSLQDQLAPSSICFGCGPANDAGLRIKSRRHGEGLITHHTPAPQHQAFTGVVCGGILGTLVDCHGNWTAAVAIMDARSRRRPAADAEVDQAAASELPSTVTASYTVKLLRPTPAGADLEITSRVAALDVDGGRADVEVEVRALGKLTVAGTGTFVEVPEGHPAHHRWS